MQKNKHIFLAEKSDIDSILNLYNKTFHPWSREQMMELFEYGAKAFIYVKDEKLLGFLIFKTVFNETEIISLTVDENVRQTGIASELLSYLFETLSTPHYVFLEVRVSNTPAIKFYEKFGMSQINVRKDYYTNPIEDALIYRKNL